MSWFSKTILDPLAKEIKNTVKDELKENLLQTVETAVIQMIDNTEFEKEMNVKGFKGKISISIDLKKE